MLDWSPDFCLSCDRQSVSGGAYCSQSCRLADLERASGGSSTGSSPQSSPTSWAPPAPHGNGFYLPPPLNFSAGTGRQPASSASSPTSPTTTRGSLLVASPSSQGSRGPTLYLSPSRTSLSSMQSTSQQESGYLSDKARNELRDYASSFDLVRDWKRRMTVV
jgi:hypothetical protein